jgi:DNA-binding transcriptional regulator YiaG
MICAFDIGVIGYLLMTADELREALSYLDLSQRDLARNLGISITTVNRWCVNKLPVPKYAAAYLNLIKQISEIKWREKQ